MPSAASEPILQLRGVVKDYGGAARSRVLHGIDLELRRGELAALVGPSGSGKSTLLNLVGLLDRPSEGELRVSGRSVAELSEAELTALRGRAIGFVFQFHHLLSCLSAVENVMMPLAIQSGATSRSTRCCATAARHRRLGASRRRARVGAVGW